MLLRLLGYLFTEGLAGERGLDLRQPMRGNVDRRQRALARRDPVLGAIMVFSVLTQEERAERGPAAVAPLPVLRAQRRGRRDRGAARRHPLDVHLTRRMTEVQHREKT